MFDNKVLTYLHRRTTAVISKPRWLFPSAFLVFRGGARTLDVYSERVKRINMFLWIGTNKKKFSSIVLNRRLVHRCVSRYIVLFLLKNQFKQSLSSSHPAPQPKASSSISSIFCVKKHGAGWLNNKIVSVFSSYFRSLWRRVVFRQNWKMARLRRRVVQVSSFVLLRAKSLLFVQCRGRRRNCNKECKKLQWKVFLDDA